MSDSKVVHFEEGAHGINDGEVQVVNMMYTEIVNDLHLALTNHRPRDVYAFCADYFRELSKLQPTYASGEEAVTNRMNLNRRRKSFSGVTFDPEKSMRKNLSITKGMKSDSDVAFLLRSFKSIHFISNLDKKAQMKVVKEMVPVDVKHGEQVLRQGDEGDFLFIVEKGQFSASIAKNDLWKEVKKYDNSGYFGELALLHETPRQATVTCVSEDGGKLWKLCRFDFKEAVCMHEHDMRESKIKLLAKMDIFENFTQKDFDKLSDALRLIEFKKPGEVIVEQGTEADSMYMILEGEVEFRKRDSSLINENNEEQIGTDEMKVVGKAGEGGYFGELGLIERCLRKATVVTLSEEVRLLKLDADKFHRLMGKCLDKMNKRLSLYN